jgi:enterochelin esterase-like enzyme
MRLHATLEDRGVTHTWSVTPGEHDDHYWAGRAGDYLQFYGLALGRAMAPRAALE